MDSIKKTENNLLMESCSPSNAVDLGEKVAQLDQVLTEEEKSFTELITKLMQTFNQTEFDVNNSEYAYKEYCSELRRQVQLAKETKILKIEDLSDIFIKQIDDYEKEWIKKVSNIDAQKVTDKINELKQETEKLNKSLEEYKVDNELIDQLRDIYSRIAFEKESLKSALFNGQILKYNDTDETP